MNANEFAACSKVKHVVAGYATEGRAGGELRSVKQVEEIIMGISSTTIPSGKGNKFQIGWPKWSHISD